MEEITWTPEELEEAKKVFSARVPGKWWMPEIELICYYRWWQEHGKKISLEFEQQMIWGKSPTS